MVFLRRANGGETGTLIHNAPQCARLAGMGFEDAINGLADVPLTPRDKLLAALEMYDEGVAMQRLNFQRRFPNLTPEELDQKLSSWLAREDESP